MRREVLGVDYGHLAPGFAPLEPVLLRRAPDRSLGLPTEYVDVLTELGPMPAWVIQAEPRRRAGRSSSTGAALAGTKVCER